MGRGRPVLAKRWRLAAASKHPLPPSGPDGAQLLARIRRELAKQRAGGSIFKPTPQERGALEWLAYESGADSEMDRDRMYAAAFALVEREAPRVLGAIQDPASMVDGLSYPLDTGEVVDLLRRAGLRVDAAGSAVRRFADEFEVPQLGSGLRRLFFARHVLQIASAILLKFSPQDIDDLGRHLAGDLNENELVVAPMIPAVPADRAYALATRSGPALTAARKRGL